MITNHLGGQEEKAHSAIYIHGHTLSAEKKNNPGEISRINSNNLKKNLIDKKRRMLFNLLIEKQIMYSCAALNNQETPI